MFLALRRPPPGADPKATANRGRAALSFLALGAALCAAGCEDRSVQAGVNAAARDAGERVDEAAERAENTIVNAADKAQDLAETAVTETREAVGDAAIKAGQSLADAGRDAKRKASEPDRTPSQ